MEGRMKALLNELGRTVTMFAAAAIIIGIVGLVMGAGSALDGELAGYAAMLVGMLGIVAGTMIFTGSGTGTFFDGMNVGMLWALAHVPYVRYFNAETGVDYEYPLPAFGAIFQMESSRSVNGDVVLRDSWGIGFLGIILVVLAVTARKDWLRYRLRQEASGEARSAG